LNERENEPGDGNASARLTEPPKRELRAANESKVEARKHVENQRKDLPISPDAGDVNSHKER
jgi:hypothetical protein